MIDNIEFVLFINSSKLYHIKYSYQGKMKEIW